MYQEYKQLLVQKDGKILVVKFYNPAKKNCLNQTAYKELERVLTEVNADDDVTIILFTGVGEYFTAGNDLSISLETTDMESFRQESMKTFKGMVSSFINCKKLIFSLVNGPAIGIGATIAGLSDVAWCSEQAYFLTPFCKLGISPEACSSYLFPLIMGRSKATEMLVFNEKLSAQDALRFHFVSRIFKLNELDVTVWPKIREYSNLPPRSMLACKRLIQLPLLDNLIRSSEAESETLAERFVDEEFINAIISFSMRKSKL